jgi:adenylate kinase family enzyme
MRRVLILGCPGSGKSTFSKQLGAATGIPVVHLDQMYWRAGWVEPTREEWMQQLGAALVEPAWIMDGNYGNTIAVRLALADAVVYLDYPAHICMWRAVRRSVLGWGRGRPDMAVGCPERFDLKFLMYIATFRRAKLPRILRSLEIFQGKVYRITQDADAAAVRDRIAVALRG